MRRGRRQGCLQPVLRARNRPSSRGATAGSSATRDASYPLVRTLNRVSANHQVRPRHVAYASVKLERVTVGIRAATAADAAAIAAVYRPYVTDSAISFESEPPRAGEMAGRMAAEPRMPWLVAERAGAVVGYA